jgi:DNA adenine methylase
LLNTRIPPLSSGENAKTIPFLKWAGGKRWLASSLIKEIGQPDGRYIEPFLGGGAIFFTLHPKNAVLGDLNTELVDTYRAIQTNWRGILDRLELHQEAHSKEYYYSIRSVIPVGQLDRAARFIYLNRTCWNGLYRVNLSGVFNVPIGTKDTVLLDTDDFEAIAKLLESAEVLADDFEPLIDQAAEGDVVFADPPYTVRHKFNGFVKYNENLFSWSDQVRLRNSLLRAVNRGAKVFVTNADHESIRSLYKDGFELTSVERYSSISGKSSTRGTYPELIITGKHITSDCSNEITADPA